MIDAASHQRIPLFSPVLIKKPALLVPKAPSLQKMEGLHFLKWAEHGDFGLGDWPQSHRAQESGGNQIGGFLKRPRSSAGVNCRNSGISSDLLPVELGALRV